MQRECKAGGTQVCIGVSGETINKYHILHSNLLFSYAGGTSSSPTGGKPFQVIFAHTESTCELFCHCSLLPSGHGKKTATLAVRLLSPTSPLHLLPQLI